MKRHIRAKLIEITGWTRDENLIDGDKSHGCESSVLHMLADQVKERLEDCTYRAEHLPFDYEFDIEDTDIGPSPLVEEVKSRLLEEYRDQFMQYDYVIPDDCEMEWQELKWENGKWSTSEQ